VGWNRSANVSHVANFIDGRRGGTSDTMSAYDVTQGTVAVIIVVVAGGINKKA